MKRIFYVVSILGLVLAGAAGAGERPSTIDEFFDPEAGLRVIAHRGFSGRAPENTIIAVRHAIAIGADMAEIDVTLSSDEEIIVIHDETLQRTTNGSGPVSQATLSELKRLDAGSWFDPLFAGEPIPTLDEVLTVVKGRMLLNIEIKSEAVERDIVAKVVAAVRRHAMEDQVVVSSFSPAALEQMRDLAPDLVTAVLYNTKFHSGRDAVDIVVSLKASVFNIKRTRLSSEMMERCRSNRIPVGVYTVNKKRHMRRLVRKGVTAIFTDHPDRMLEALGRNPAEAAP